MTDYRQALLKALARYGEHRNAREFVYRRARMVVRAPLREANGDEIRARVSLELGFLERAIATVENEYVGDELAQEPAPKGVAERATNVEAATGNVIDADPLDEYPIDVGNKADDIEADPVGFEEFVPRDFTREATEHRPAVAESPNTDLIKIDSGDGELNWEDDRRPFWRSFLYSILLLLLILSAVTLWRPSIVISVRDIAAADAGSEDLVFRTLTTVHERAVFFASIASFENLDRMFAGDVNRGLLQGLPAPTSNAVMLLRREDQRLPDGERIYQTNLEVARSRSGEQSPLFSATGHFSELQESVAVTISKRQQRRAKTGELQQGHSIRVSYSDARVVGIAAVQIEIDQPSYDGSLDGLTVDFIQTSSAPSEQGQSFVLWQPENLDFLTGYSTRSLVQDAQDGRASDVLAADRFVQLRLAMKLIYASGEPTVVEVILQN